MHVVHTCWISTTVISVGDDDRCLLGGGISWAWSRLRQGLLHGLMAKERPWPSGKGEFSTKVASLPSDLVCGPLSSIQCMSVEVFLLSSPMGPFEVQLFCCLWVLGFAFFYVFVLLHSLVDSPPQPSWGMPPLFSWIFWLVELVNLVGKLCWPIHWWERLVGWWQFYL